jgi:hypothetical protein
VGIGLALAAHLGSPNLELASEREIRLPVKHVYDSLGLALFTLLNTLSDVSISARRGFRRIVQPIPNFFLVGAARSGTTSLWRYLSNHPDVYMPYLKEPAFFGSDLTKTPNEFAVLEKAAYLRLFEGSEDKVVRGEGSVLYLISKTAAQEIYDFNPAAKILISLRNPVDMLHSYHGQMHWVGHEDIGDFEEALALEGERRRGRRIPKNAMVPEALYYSEVARFSLQVERYLKVFPRSQIKIMLYDDLVKAPQKAYESVQDFLGIPRIPPASYKAKSAYKVPRSTAFAGMVQRPPRVARLLLDFLPPKIRFLILIRSLHLLNTRIAKKVPMRPALRQELTECYTPEIRALSVLINRDLSEWLTSPISE